MYFKLFIFSLFVIIGCKNENRTIDIDNNLTQDTMNLELDDKDNELDIPDHRNWSKNASIYEVNVLNYSKEGTINAVTKDLIRIDNLGFKILSLMPIQATAKDAIGNETCNYYSIHDYMKINSNIGKLEDFKNLVKTAHTLGLKILIDWVGAYSSHDNQWLKTNKEFYKLDSLGKPILLSDSRGNAAEFNYGNQDLRAQMQKAMKFWMIETQLDGFVFKDAEEIPMDFWADSKAKLDSIKPTFLIAEGNNPELFTVFDAIYNDNFQNLIVDIAEDRRSINAIQAFIRENQSRYDPQNILLYYSCLHDETTFDYIESDKFGSNLYNYKALTYFMGGMPLVFNGQETGINNESNFGSGETIHWGTYENSEFYKNLNSIFRNNEVLWNNSEVNYEFLSSNEDSFNFIISNGDKHLAVLQNYSSYPQYVSKISLTGLNLEKNLLKRTDFEPIVKGVKVPPHSTVVFGQ